MTDTLSEKIAAIKAGLGGVPDGPWSFEPYERGGYALPDNPAGMTDADGNKLLDCSWASATHAGQRLYEHIARLDRRTVGEIIDRLETLETENERLRAALKPFAKEAAQWGSGFTDDGRIYVLPTGSGNNRAKFNVGDLRRARAALEDKL